MGINAGEVISGKFGSTHKREFTVMGDAVNVASRLEDASAAGQILVGEETYRNTKEHFKYTIIDPVQLKGKAKPVASYQLTGKRPIESFEAPREDRHVSSELVGRAKEFDKLQLHVLKLLNGEGSIVAIIGDAGIGKSRLISELKSREEAARIQFVEGRADSIGKNIGFHPIRDAVRNWARIQAEDDTDETRHKLERLIGRISPGDETDFVPLLCNLLGINIDGHHSPEIGEMEGEALLRKMVDVVKKLLVCASRETPLVFILEDLHSFDESSIEILESIFRLVEEHPILFIALFRPRYEQTGERIRRTATARHASHYREIGLKPLAREHSEALIKNLLRIEGLPYGLREQIVDRSGGNPFFAEEVVRSLIDDGSLDLQERIFRFKSDAEPLVIPRTIDEVVMSRIDRLEEDVRHVLLVASVIGRSFMRSILSGVAVRVSGLDDKLDLLKDIHFIREQKRSDDTEFFFEHVVTQEVIYRSILLQTRKTIHAAVGRAIEELYQDRIGEVSAVLAFHYGQGDDLDKAEVFLIKAGNAALESSASSEALNLYHEALQLYLAKAGAMVASSHRRR